MVSRPGGLAGYSTPTKGVAMRKVLILLVSPGHAYKSEDWLRGQVHLAVFDYCVIINDSLDASIIAVRNINKLIEEAVDAGKTRIDPEYFVIKDDALEKAVENADLLFKYCKEYLP